MRIIFVRHGHPDYTNDCLTSTGHLQAAAAAKRLKTEKIAKMYSSTCGRAVETAKHIAAEHEAELEFLDFMREIGGGSIDETVLPHGGQPWHTADDMVSRGEPLLNANWAAVEPFCKNVIVLSAKRVAKEFDLFLSSCGYKREEAYYRIERQFCGNILITSHAGSASTVLAHLLNLPLPFVFGVLKPDFTSISVINFSGNIGDLIAPQIELLNDSAHIADLGTIKALHNT